MKAYIFFYHSRNITKKFEPLFTKLLYFELWEPGVAEPGAAEPGAAEPGAAEPGASYKNRRFRNPGFRYDTNIIYLEIVSFSDCIVKLEQEFLLI